MCDAQQLMLMDRVDFDCDGLIEIDSLNDLNNIRYNLAGTSSRTASTPDGEEGEKGGCPTPENPVDHDGDSNTPALQACYGYELMNDLDFDPGNDGPDNDPYYHEGLGWQPIGTPTTPLATTFDGNGYAIANLFINGGAKADVGLFGALGSSGEIRNLGVVDAEVSGRDNVGGLVGSNLGTITASYVHGAVSAVFINGGLVGFNRGSITASYVHGAVLSTGSSGTTGGLIGSNGNTGTITASYAVATVSANSQVGGLIGVNDDGTITASYAVATVSGNSGVGGLVGVDSNGTITDSYFNTDLTEQTEADQGKTTSKLQGPIDNTGIYSTWDAVRWNFGSNMQYPALKLLPRADGSCPAAASANVMIEAMGDQCIHRPVAWLAFGSVAADDSGRLNADHITNNRKPRLTAQMTFLPANSAVRLKSASTEVSTTTDANGSFTVRVDLTEGPNVFEAFATLPGAETEIGPLGTLTITLDMTSPTLDVSRTSRGISARFMEEANPDSIAYGILDTASEPPQLCDTSFDAAMSYTLGNVLPARNAQSEAIEYCFVATDLAGNQAAGSSVGVLPSALRLRLRVFLESALP